MPRKAIKLEVTPTDSIKVEAEPKNKEIAITEPKLDIEPMTVSPAVLRDRMKLETERRKVLTDYISANLVPGKDYGTIEFQTKSGKTVESKPTLFKPGAEKFCSLFGLQATFEKDYETWEMMGSKPGTIAYICKLTTKSGSVVGEGRGIAEITEKQGWTFNNCVKIAEKRAQIDAVLRSGGLSDFFTQDLEDQAQQHPQQATRPQNAWHGPEEKITQPQMRLLFQVLRHADRTKAQFEAQILKRLNVIGVENLSKKHATAILDQLIKQYGMPPREEAKPQPPQEEVPVIQLDDEQEEAAPAWEDINKKTSGPWDNPDQN